MTCWGNSACKTQQKIMEKITMQLKDYKDGDRIREIFNIRKADSNRYDFNSIDSYYSLDDKNLSTCTRALPDGFRLINNKEELNLNPVYEIY